MKSAIFFILMMFGTVTLVAGQPRAESLVMALSDWPPYKSETMDAGGIVTDLTRQALSAAGYNVLDQFVPWRRALSGTYDGTYDVVPAIWYSEERAQQLLFSKPIMNSQIVFVSRREQPFDFKALSDLSGMHVGVSAGWRYPDAFNQLTTIRKDEAKNLKDNLRKLIHKRVDVVIGEELAVRHTVREYFKEKADRLYYSAKRLQSEPLRVAVSKKHPNGQEVIDRLNGALESLYSSGQYLTVLKKHGILESSFVKR